jgi:TRAP transporter TAXI family solute receptor
MAGCLLFVVLLLAGAAPSVAQDMGVITGSEKGTYYQFGLDLQKLVKASGVNLSVHPSKGSVENIFAVYQRPGVQLGIVQSDVLAFVSRLQNDPVLNRIAKKTKMVFPLYNEEVHLVGKRGIRDFDDLAGRRVAVGREGSGTYLTARLLFKLSEVAPREMVFIDTEEALKELKAGRIDAMFYVVGYPARLLKEDVVESDQLAVIPILNKSIVEFYPVAEIPAGTYAWQPTAVSTVAAKAVLISFDFRRRDCDSVGKVAQLIASRHDWLQKNGHPKWKAVDLNYPLRGWEQYDCVQKALGKSSAAVAGANPRTGLNPVFDAIKGVLGD